jgi:hypothetical protein
MTDRPKKILLYAVFLSILVQVVQPLPVLLWAAPDTSVESYEDPSHRDPCKNINLEWGGHLKARGTVSWPHKESMFGLVGTGAYYDGSMEGRLKNRLSYKDRIYLETHYEMTLSGGDTRRKQANLKRFYSALFNSTLFLTEPIEDDRRFMDLTHTIEEDEGYILYHRLDRLSLTLMPDWGSIIVGRQAITWGNGLLFNPMDLFNPFSPTDIEREYKVGDDMISAQLPVTDTGDFQLLYVPRRDPSTGRVKNDQSSLAGKFHFALGTTEFDLMGARHYEDTIVGLGSTGYLGDAAWRFNTTYTFADEDTGKQGFFAFVINMDYSWVWCEKNLYGFLEFYYTDLGNDDYGAAYTDPDILERLYRGERFTLGRAYTGGNIQIELHPLFNVYLTVINNLEDLSGIVQPRAVWDMTQNIQMVFGGNIYYGGSDTEYGGFRIPDVPFLIKPSSSIFLWLNYYF